MRNKQYNNNETFKIIERIRTSISIKENEILNKKKRSKLCHNFKRIRTQILVFNIYKIREIIIYKRLS